jgi:DNA mismatch repair protein MutS2
MSHAFKPGDRVHVASIGTGTIREVRNNDHCIVEIKGHAVLVAVSALETVAPARTQKQKRGHPKPVTSPGERDSAPVVSIDLHGKTVLEALDALDAFLNEALLAGAGTAHVIHGRSGGHIKRAVHARLGHLPSIRGFRLDPRNPGVTIVML